MATTDDTWGNVLDLAALNLSNEMVSLAKHGRSDNTGTSRHPRTRPYIENGRISTLLFLSYWFLGIRLSHMPEG